MPIQSVFLDQEGYFVLYLGKDRYIAVLLSSLDGFPTNKETAGEDLRVRLQNFIDDLLDSDLIVTGDPLIEQIPKKNELTAGVISWITEPTLGWLLQSNTIYLVNRSIVVEVLGWQEDISNFKVLFTDARYLVT